MAYQNCGMTHTYLHQYDNSDQLVSYEIKLLHTVNNMTILKENSNISSTFVLSPRLKMDLSPYLLIWIHHPLMCSILCDRAAQDLFTSVTNHCIQICMQNYGRMDLQIVPSGSRI